MKATSIGGVNDYSEGYTDMAKLRQSTEGVLAFYCPGCGYEHYVSVGPPNQVIWKWNGSMDQPTFSPSILTWRRWQGQDEKRCHSYVRDGKIEFLGDCEHDLAGQTIDLLEVDEWPKSDDLFE